MPCATEPQTTRRRPPGGRPAGPAPLTVRQRRIMALRHPADGSAPPTLERVARDLVSPYAKVYADYERAKTAIFRLKRQDRLGAELGPDARADLDRFGGCFR